VTAPPSDDPKFIRNYLFRQTHQNSIVCRYMFVASNVPARRTRYGNTSMSGRYSVHVAEKGARIQRRRELLTALATILQRTWACRSRQTTSPLMRTLVTTGITSSHVQAMQSQLVMVNTTPRAGFSLSTPERMGWAHVTAIPIHLQGAAEYVAALPLSSKRPES
jgi:hypothetical protein